MGSRRSDIDAIHPSGEAIAEVKLSADALRTVRAGLVTLAYALEDHPRAKAYLLLVDPAITRTRLLDEWRRAESVMQPSVLSRISVCLLTAEGDLHGVPEDPPPAIAEWLIDVADREAGSMPARAERADYEFIVFKLLVYRLLTGGGPVKTAWLARTAGCSYPTVARVLKGLGSIVERETDRRVALRFLPKHELLRFFGSSERARSTARFVDRSGQPRDPETHLRRLQKIGSAKVAIGGVLGARHYVPTLDLVGSPRLDLSVHSPDAAADLDLVQQLDPALRQEHDPQKPANVVIHSVRHADALFTPRADGLAWADPVECLLDLHEARLESQASYFLEELERRPYAVQSES